MSKELQIRKAGCYEIVLCDANKKRITEFVVELSYHDTKLLRDKLKQEHGAASSWISRVMDNDLYNVHSAPKGE